MNKPSILSCLLWLAATALWAQQPADYVDPLIGSGGHGHVFVGANVPFGYVQLGPTNVTQGWDWCSGYHASDRSVIGFSHTHLSGTGCGDLLDVTLMPVTGNVAYSRGDSTEGTGLWSYQDKAREVARAGYYKTFLTRYGIEAEMTATSHVGLHRYTFPAADDAGIVVDLVNGGNWDRPVESCIRVVDDRTIEGYRYSTGWASDERVFFRAVFSKPFAAFHLICDGTETAGRQTVGRNVYGRADFKTAQGEQVLVKVALSSTGCDGAARNLQAELPTGFDFDTVSAQARQAWNDALGCISVKASETGKQVFYTALYHTMIAPSEFSDADGTYYGADHRVHAGQGRQYTTLSLWDTYRAEHPLLTIIDPERDADIINTMVNIHRQQGKLPVWHLMGCETNCMVGYPAIPVIADAITKDIKGFDWDKAYRAMTETTNTDERGIKEHREYGYIPYEKMNHENVAYEMEYDIADWALAQAARKLGRDADHQLYERRSHQWQTLFDPATRLVRAKSLDGSFRTPFDPVHQQAGGDDYTEGNAWQYTFLVPHDLDGLVRMFGSKKELMVKLDSLFTYDEAIGDQATPDISGLIGQYAHGNEPSHHTAYFYTMLGEPDKTADIVRRVMDEMYTTGPEGLPGNEDVGQMSAWYVLSAMGIYQVEPAGGRFWFGSPAVDEATIKVPGGTFRIIAHGNTAKHRHIRRATLNGKKLDRWFIDYADIMRGGTLEFYMK